MATEIVAGQLGEIRAAGTTGGGTALTTTPTYIQLPRMTNHLFITPRNFASACEVAQVSLNPWLVVLKTTDNMVTRPTDYSEQAQDASTSTYVTLGALGALTAGDFLLVGSHLPFRGAYATVSTANTTGSLTLNVHYWNGSAWVDYSDTDGTSADTTFAQNGLVYWTVVSAWKMARLGDLYPECPSIPETTHINLTIPMYWTRWSVSAAISSTVLSSLVSANRSTNYFELLGGQTLEQKIKHGVGGIGCVEARTDVGTANLLVGVATIREGEFE